MADPNRGEGAPPREVHIGKAEKKTNWFAWLALAAGILALLVALGRCGRDEEAASVVPAAVPAAEPVAPPPATTAADATPAGLSGVGPYLAGTEATPRIFAFERLTFSTGSSEVDAQNREEIAALATALRPSQSSRLRIIGYADARGPSPANTRLGKARADSVKEALVAAGVPADRLETASGGEDDPVGSNATAAGQAENRRTELVLLQR